MKLIRISLGLLAILTALVSFSSTHSRWSNIDLLAEVQPGSTSFMNSLLTGSLTGTLTGTLTGLLTWTLTLTCDDIEEFDWTLVPTALVPGDTSDFGLGEFMSHDLILNINKFFQEPLTGLPSAILAVDINDISGLPEGLTADYPTEQLLPMTQTCIPISGEAAEIGLYEANLNCDVTVFLGGTPFTVEDYSFNHWIHVTGDSAEVSEVQDLEGFALTCHPNPGQDQIRFRGIRENMVWQADLLAMSGQRVASFKGTGNSTIDVSNIPRGMYILHINLVGKQTTSQRILLQ